MPVVDYYRYLGCTITSDLSPNDGLTGIIQKAHGRYISLRAALLTETLRFRICSFWSFIVPHFLGAPIFLASKDAQAFAVMEAILLRTARLWLGLSLHIPKEVVFWVLGTDVGRITRFSLALAGRKDDK